MNTPRRSSPPPLRSSAEQRQRWVRWPDSFAIESARGPLGFGADFGSIVAGKRADLIAVRVPHGVEDVEEYLLTGIEPDAIRWLA